jgi:hypothetical protein
MKRFLAIYTGTERAAKQAGWDKLDAAARKAREAGGMNAWMEWGERHKGAIVDRAPLGKTKRASRDGVADITNAMTGYVIVEAESHEAAAMMFQNHPHFAIFPGDGVEIMEMLPLPER